MKRALPLIAAALAFSTPVYAQEHVEIGRLECEVEGGIGLIIGSSKDAVCNYYDAEATEPTEVYYGQVNKFGLDVGFTEESVIQWLVFAPAKNAYDPGVLAGSYVGLGAEATAGVGVGANALVGGSSDSFTLQPVSVQGQTGLNVAMGVTGFTLRAAP